VEEFRGLNNFAEVFFGDPLFWQTFKLVGILLAANLVQMWPCIFTAIVLHRVASERWKYVYRVLFVIPMVIPSLVWLLIWKSFYDPNVGILNSFLNKTGLMQFLKWLDGAMPALAGWLSPIRSFPVDPVFGSVWGLAVFGFLTLAMINGLRGMLKGWFLWVVLLGTSLTIWAPVPWAFPARWALGLGAVLVGGEILSRSGEAGRNALKWVGGSCVALAAFLILFSMTWTEPTGAFDTGTPAWLGHSKLIIPSILFWGFPWVGTIGVLIYLAGLQNISQDVYEAADIDGAGALRKMFQIELPLILTQVRINLIFMTIGTLNGYGLFLILLGSDGGPDNKGMVPGLYMYNEGFVKGRFGYACALGMVMFVIIMIMTVLYNNYVKVEK
jgi:ABC-type sugar transport system permease subunit